MAKLESFIENYLKNKKIADYEGWLALYGEDAEGAYLKKRADADNAYAKTRAEHGARAAALYEKGLNGSGYSDYLTHAAYAKRGDTLDRALRQKAATEESNRKGYISYIDEMAKAEAEVADVKRKEEEKIFNDLLSRKLLDVDSAVSYLTSRGIESARAEELARESLSIHYGSKSYFSEVIAEMTAADMDYNNAYQYALLKGLSDEAAKNAASLSTFYASQQNRKSQD